MKHLILFISLFFGIIATGSAQTTTKKAKKATTTKANKKSTSNTKKNTAKKTSKQKPSKALNNRRIYHWEDGQRATPTGHEATGTGGGYASIVNDTAAVRDTIQKKKKEK